MKNKIKQKLKNNNILYNCYYYIMSNLLKFLGLFVRIDNKIILINSFGGKKYDDSTKAIYEYMIENEKYKYYKFYWAFDDINTKIPGPAKIIKNDSFKYFIIALKAKYWISNSSIERGLKFKKKKTIYINTWHGSAFKKMGIDTNESNYRFNFSQYDYMFAQSNYDIEIFSHAFEMPKENFVLVGLPRNDELVDVKEDEITKIKEKLGLPKDKKIILYAPTFRDYEKEENNVVAKPPLNLENWKKELGKEYIVLFRAHYEVAKVLNIKNDGFIYDFTKHKNLNELMKISDILISDYSSIIFDYSILNRPIFSYAYDLEVYEEKRGLYRDWNKELPNGYIKEENELINKIKNIDWEEQKKHTTTFRKKYVEECGNARKFIDNIIK